MIRARRGAIAVLWGSLGCYSGVGSFQQGGGDAEDDAPGTQASDAPGDGDGGGDDEPSADGQCLGGGVGPTPLRRLTAEHYDRTIRDLLGVQTSYRGSFSPDERMGAFKSNAAAPVGDLQVEQYMDAAEAIAEERTADLASLLPCDPATTGEDACAEALVRELAPRAWRRPLDESEVASLMAVYHDARAAGDLTDGVRVALQAILQSPFFLYHVELGETPAEDDAPVRLTAWELASRLSYFVWGSMPDEALFAAAEAGELGTPEGLDEQVERMLDDPKAAEAIASFHLQWLGVDELATLEKSPAVFPDFDEALALAMRDETAAFANWVITSDDARLHTLLSRPVTLSEDPRLLDLYGVSVPADHVPGDPIALDPSRRAGLLTHAGVLARHAHADQTSPVHRGKLVRENFLCTPLPPPPPDVDNVPPEPTPGATTRERFSQHTADPACQGCHALVDGLGFGLESYDAIGAFRATEDGLPVDASGEIVGTDDIDGAFVGGVELSERLADSEQVHACVARQWFRFGLGRMDTPDDDCALARIEEAFAESDSDVRELIRAIVLDDAFRLRMPPQTEPS